MNEIKVIFRAFESCPHCRNIFFFYLETVDPDTIMVIACKSKEEGFLMLAAIRYFSATPMTDIEFRRINMLISASSLPVEIPSDSALEALRSEHMNNPMLQEEIKHTIDFIHHAHYHKPPDPNDLN